MNSLAFFRCLSIAALALWLGGCSVFSTVAVPDASTEEPSPLSLSTRGDWLLGEFVNNSQQHSADSTLTALLETHLRDTGVVSLASKSAKAHYRIAGHIDRWTYLAGASPRPAITIYLSVYDADSDRVLWSDERDVVGSRRESLTVLADRVLADLVQQMPIDDKALEDEVKTGDLLAGLDYLDLVSSSANGRVSDSTLSGGALALRSAGSSVDEQRIRTDRPLNGRSIAFYYAAQPPVDILSQFDRLVLEPDNISAEQLAGLGSQGAITFAYLSVGEIGPSRSYAKDINAEWVVGKNAAWGSLVLDLSNPDLRGFLLSRVGELARSGYHGVFLDTMDSYYLAASTDEEVAVQQQGLVSLIRSIAVRYPDMRIIVNRGFEILDDIAIHVEAVAAESLYASWDNVSASYGGVPEKDREWLVGRLEHARTLNLDVIAIDYVPPKQRNRARQVASEIARLGYIPWVATPAMDYVGVGALEVVPREVLMIYDSEIDGPMHQSGLHTLLAMPLEYMGYVPRYIDIAKELLPAGELKGRFAGVVMWPQDRYSRAGFKPWLFKQLESSVPVAFFGRPPVSIDAQMEGLLGIKTARAIDMSSARLVLSGSMLKPERAMPRRFRNIGFATSSIASGNTVHARFKDGRGQVSEPVVTGDFGGFAWDPVIVDVDIDYFAYWLIEPFQFLQTALQLPNVPQPDVTSENGKRLWMAHIDGDALTSWAEFPERKLGAEFIYERVLTRYTLPHTVSIVEAEMTKLPGMNDRRARMFSVARKTFALDHVDIASHTFSHPFNWARLGKVGTSGRYNLPLPGYTYDAEREIAGSIDFINRLLAPEGKKTEVMLWSGNALPRASDLQIAAELGVPNVNGGFTSISRIHPSYTRVAPMARPVGGYLQVYAPIMNENVYTDEWRGPFDGYRDVIGTFEMTDFPRRLKPINIYYHFYSGTKAASLNALYDVYDWSLSQDIYPIHLKDYSDKVHDFRKAGVARYLDGYWKLSRLGNIRSMRLLEDRYWPDLRYSKGIAGARQLHDGLYLHTDGRDTVMFRTTRKSPQTPFLASSNGRVSQWEKTAEGLVFRVQSEVPAEVEIGGIAAGACRVMTAAGSVYGTATKTGTVSFRFKEKDTGHASLYCQA